MNTIKMNLTEGFGMAAIPYRTLRHGSVRTRYDTQHFSKSGTTSIGSGTRRQFAGILRYTGNILRFELVWYGLKTLPNNPVWLGTN